MAAVTIGSSSIRSVVHAGNVLVGAADNANAGVSRRNQQTLSSILLRRLADFRSIAAAEDWHQDSCLLAVVDATSSEARLKQLTADSAAFALSLISSHLELETTQPSASTSKAPAAPTFGSNDIRTISTLAGIVGRWGLVTRVLDGIIPAALGDIAKPSAARPAKDSSRIVEIVEDENAQGRIDSDRLELIYLVERILSFMLLVNGDRGDTPRGQLSAIVTPQLILALLAVLIQLVYHDNVESWAKIALQDIIMRTSPVALISHLLVLLSSASSKNEWLRPALSTLLTERLVTHAGVRSLLIVVVGNSDNLTTQKLSMLSRLVRSGVTGAEKAPYLKNVVAQLAEIVQRASDAALPPSSLSSEKGLHLQPPPPPLAITQASCFILSDLIDRYTDAMESALHPRLHYALLPARYPPASISNYDPADLEALDPLVASSDLLFRSLSLLSMIMLHAPPSPNLLPFLLNSITPTLFSLASYLTSSSADPVMLDEVETILETWGKAASLSDAVRGVIRAVERIEEGEEFGSSSIEENAEMYWARSDEGSACVRMRMPAAGNGLREDPLKLKLDPEGMIRWLRGVARKDLSSAVFMRWLDEVQSLRAVEGFSAAKRSVLRLQLVVRMVDEFGSELLSQPTQIIAFVAHALDSDSTTKRSQAELVDAKSGLGLDDLKIAAGELERGYDDDDDDETLLPGSGVDEITMTAVTLLLAVLESDESLSMATTPLLSLIYDKLDLLVNSDSEIVSPLARDARLILSLRKASNLASPSASSLPATSDPLAASRERYQEALKLLQDPILPVRAQGLSILRGLVASRAALLSTDPALLPAVLEIFVQAIEDEDSFLYLNAVEGLSCMVDVYGKQIVVRLVEVYLGGRKRAAEDVGNGEKGRRELDKRLKIGETLVRVVERAGEAFAVLVDDLVPSLLLTLRTSSLPVPLRSSTLTILATAIETAPIALLPYSSILTEACLTLLSLESRRLLPRRPVSSPSTSTSKHASFFHSQDEDTNDEEDNRAPPLDRHGKPKRPEETPDPVSSDAKHPVLRRSAILFLGLLFRAVSVLQDQEAEKEDRGMMYDSMNPLANFSISGQPKQVGSRMSRSLLSVDDMARAVTVLRYIGDTDEDSLVRHQAKEVLSEIGG